MLGFEEEVESHGKAELDETGGLGVVSREHSQAGLLRFFCGSPQLWG